jgi:hypothetical protein
MTIWPRGAPMSQLAVVLPPSDGPVHRSIVAVDVEGSTKRTNPAKGKLRRVLYDLLDRALRAAGIGPRHLEELADYNAAVADPELRMRLRAVVHAGEVHNDGWGFYGDDIDVAFRLLEAPTVKRVLRDAPEAPLVLVVSEEIWAGVVRHGYVDGGSYQQRVQVKVGERRRRGRVHLPVPARSGLSALVPRSRTPLTPGSRAVASLAGPADRATAG